MQDEFFNDIILELLEIFDYIPLSNKGAIWEEIEQRIQVLVDQKTTYYHQIDSVIHILETNVNISDYEIDAYAGRSFKAHQFRDAKRMYAQAVLYQKYNELANQIVFMLYNEFEKLIDRAEVSLNPSSKFSFDDIVVSFECENCWAPHTRESTDGKEYYWLDKQLDGLNGISWNVYGIWITINCNG